MSETKSVKVIEVRYRDIPWEEARKCQTIKDEKKLRRYWEQEQRGRIVSIECPSVPPTSDTKIVCVGPFFQRHEESASHLVVCPHIAEIGD